MSWKWKTVMPLLLLGIILLVSGEIVVHEGNLRTVNCFNAIMSMTGDSSHKSLWWQFLPYLNASSSQAFLAYMVSNFSGTNLTEEIAEKGGLFSTRPASILEHYSENSIASLGVMRMTLWVLGFVCLDETTGACHKFTPVVLQNVDSKLAFFSLWEEHDGKFSNAVTSQILGLANQNLEEEKVSKMMLRYTNQSQVPLCKDLRPIVSEGNTTIELSGKLKVKIEDVIMKTAPEAAGFNLNSRTDSVIRPKRNLCLMGVENTSQSNFLDTTNLLVEILGSFVSHVKDRYIQAQNAALDLKHPDIDFWLVAITLPSAFLAVLTAAIPIINFQLKLFRGALNTSRVFKTVLLCLCNSVLSVASYSGIIALIPSEMTRQKKFKTWGLLADKVPLTARGLDVLVVVQAESNYTSRSLILVFISIAVLVPMVILLTVYRCNQVFRRRMLLKDLRRLEDSREEPLLDDLRAIEMSTLEQHKLKNNVRKLKAQQRTMRRVRSIP